MGSAQSEITHIGGDNIEGHSEHREEGDSCEGYRNGKLSLSNNDVAICERRVLTHKVAYQKNETRVTKIGARFHNKAKHNPFRRADRLATER